MLKSATLVGAGNTGSHVGPHLARMAEIGHLLVIDPDRFEAKNISGQAITRRDVGKPKAEVLAKKLRQINPELQVTAMVDKVQNVPLGILGADVILGDLDSREGRRWLAEAAWHVSAPYIDAGVAPDGLLARVSVYMPAPNAPCHQCSWSQDDYDALEQVYPCPAGSPTPAPTNAPSSLGALAASLQAIECKKLLAGWTDQLLTGRELLVDAAWNKHFVTMLRRNPDCRFDHQIWNIETVSSRLSTGDAFRLATKAQSERPRAESSALKDLDCALWVEGQMFVRQAFCAGCGRARRFMRLGRRLRRAERFCTWCGGELVVSGFDRIERLRPTDLPPRLMAKSLVSLGFQPGDVFSVEGPSGERHFMVQSPEQAAER